MNITRRMKGLTLVELIIVVSIIVLLLLIAITYFRSQLFKGLDTKRKADVNRIKVAIEEYEKDHDCYPPPQIVVCDPGTGLSPYLDKIPCDPGTKSSYFYDYESAACPSWYRIYTNLDNIDTATAPQCGPNGAFNYFASSPNAPACNLNITDSLYGCKNAVCVPLYWDATRPGPECDPNYQSPTCYGQCGTPQTECKMWSH